MKVNHLKMPPPSGEYEELRFNVKGDAEWFMFNPNDSESFVGVFGAGKAGNSFALTSTDSRLILIVSHGQAYLLDSLSRELLWMDDTILEGGLAIPGRPEFIVYDMWVLYIFDKSGYKIEWGWEINTVEDIKIDQISDKEVTGTVYHYESKKRIPWRIDLIEEIGYTRQNSEWKILS